LDEKFNSINLEALPDHVAIIMDGNGRWAKERGKIRSIGHHEGLENAKRIAKAAADIGLKYVTLYIFSTENWKRTQQEVGYLMDLIRKNLRQEFEFYKANKIRLQYIGNLKGLPEDIQNDIIQAQNDTAHFTGTTLVLAINYGGRDEIVRAVKKIVESETSVGDIDEQLIYNNLDVPQLPEVDLLIRTGGELRVSNFLLWQSAYAEFIFTPTLWPDYSKDEFYNHIVEFQKRTRRFGAVPV